MISGERQKVTQKAVRWPCGVCGRGIGNNSIQCSSCWKAKTQTMVFGGDNIDQPVKIDDCTFENVTWFTYLGSVFTHDNDRSQDLWTRINKATE